MILVSLAHPFKSFFHSILLWLDSIIYSFVEMSYGIFLKLANTNLFTEQFYKDFAQRIYAVLGVVMLFVIAYALLKALIDPDQLTKGDKGIAKLIPTFVTSLIIIGLLPTIFSFAYGVQNFILKNNLVGVLIFGSSGESDAINDFGGTLAYTTLTTFVNPTNVAGPFDGLTWEEISNGIKDQGIYTNIVLLTDAIADGEVTYNWFFSQAVGIFLVYLLITFCLDLGVRSVRLAFLQLIAPIPILMRVVPTKNELFKNWVKKTTSSFMEVFVRIFIMYMAVYFISNLSGIFDSLAGSGIEGLLIKLIIIMGILMFVKEFPKLLQDITGIDSGNIKLGIKDFMGKLGAGGALAAAGVFGAGSTAMVRNLVHGVPKAFQSFAAAGAQGLTFKQRAAAIGHGAGQLFSGVAGGISGGVRGFAAGHGAQNFADVRNAAAKGAQGATDARNYREAYRASHGNSTVGALYGHMEDAIIGSAEWAQGGFEAEDKKIKYYNDVLEAREKSKEAAKTLMEKNDTNLNLMTQAGSRADWKNGAGALFAQMKDANGNQMSLGAIRSYVESMSKERIDSSDFRDENGVIDQTAFEAAKRNQSMRVSSYQDMLKQLEKAAWQTIEGASMDQSLASSIDLTPEKLSGVRRELDNMNNIRQSNGDAMFNSSLNNGKDFNDAITELENTRNKLSADLEKKKRAREERQKKSGGNNKS